MLTVTVAEEYSPPFVKLHEVDDLVQALASIFLDLGLPA